MDQREEIALYRHNRHDKVASNAIAANGLDRLTARTPGDTIELPYAKRHMRKQYEESNESPNRRKKRQTTL